MYVSKDLDILSQMIVQSAQVPLTGQHNKKSLILPESHGEKYEVKITGVNPETIAIAIDRFPDMRKFFNQDGGICKRADFAIITDGDYGKFIVVIELKAGDQKNKEVIQQLQGAQALISYFQKIGKIFFSKSDFLENYEYRFVSMKDVKIAKKPTVNKKNPKIHDRPENMLCLSGYQQVQFKRLIHQHSIYEFR